MLKKKSTLLRRLLFKLTKNGNERHQEPAHTFSVAPLGPEFINICQADEAG